MTRAEFMQRLAELLSDVSPSEREEAIQYYNDYFEDAGAENEQAVLESLGTPEAVVKTMKAGLGNDGEVGEFTEKGFCGCDNGSMNEIMNPQTYADTKDDNAKNAGAENGYGKYENPYGNRQTEINKAEKKKMSAGMIVLLVILALLASPFLIGIAAGLVGILVGIACTLLGLVVGFGVAAVALFAVGICLFVYAITLLASIPLGGLVLIGGAMICVALGLLFLWLTVLVCFLIPAVVRGIAKVFQKILHRGGEKA